MTCRQRCSRPVTALVARDDRTLTGPYSGFGGDRFRTRDRTRMHGSRRADIQPARPPPPPVSLLHLGGTPWAQIGEQSAARCIPRNVKTRDLQGRFDPVGGASDSVPAREGLRGGRASVPRRTPAARARARSTGAWMARSRCSGAGARSSSTRSPSRGAVTTSSSTPASPATILAGRTCSTSAATSSRRTTKVSPRPDRRVPVVPRQPQPERAARDRGQSRGR